MSGWSAPSVRSLVEGDNWESSWADLGFDVPRMDQIMEGVGFTLARRPELGSQIEGDLFGIPTRPFRDAPGLVIYYRFTDGEVLLEGVGEAEPEEWDSEES